MKDWVWSVPFGLFVAGVLIGLFWERIPTWVLVGSASFVAGHVSMFCIGVLAFNASRKKKGV